MVTFCLKFPVSSIKGSPQIHCSIPDVYELRTHPPKKAILKMTTAVFSETPERI
jgi:hypothetical protein